MRCSGSILVVDDDPALRDSVQFLLELEGYNVRAVPAAVALALMLRQQPDLVLLDLDMPVIDGPEVRAYLLSDPNTAGIPVVAMAEAERMEELRDMRTQGALLKPLNYQALIDEVARHLQPV